MKGYERSDLSKAMTGDLHESPRRFEVRVITERPYRPTTSRSEFINKADVMEAMTKSLARGDAQVRNQDLSLLDRGVIRAAVFEHLHLGGTGERLAKSRVHAKDAIRSAFAARMRWLKPGSEEMRKAAQELEEAVAACERNLGR
jgi:hypothetical protein